MDHTQLLSSRAAGVLSLLALLCTTSLRSGPGRFSLEQVMSAGFPSEMTASPAGDALAWVINERGVRNLWVARWPHYRGQQVTPYALDDGQSISQLAWTPDGASIVFVRGDGANQRGERPNPLSRARAARQVILKLDLESREIVELGAGTEPVVDPEGKRVLFLREGQIWMASLAGESGPAPWIEARGTAGTLRWSPDGRHLAFVSRRTDHSFVGIVSRDPDRIEYLDPSVDQDSDPVWSPEGDQIAFVRTPFDRERLLFGPVREALPWSIQVYDLRERTARTLWRSDPGPGSVYHRITASDQLFWSRGNHLVFPWEKDGWTHLYSIPVTGGAPRLLTPGPFEVEEVSPAADGAALYFSSNQDDPNRRHLWRLEASGGPARQITSGPSNEWSPVPLSPNDELAFIRSTGRSPARPAVLLARGTVRLLAPEAVDADFPASLLVEPKPVVFQASDGLRVHGQLFLPPPGQTREERGPAVLFFHGGPRRQMLLGFHYLSYYSRCYAFHQYLANRGLIVLSVNYRGGVGYGMEFREAADFGASGASEFKDVLAAAAYLRGRSDVDPDRIGLWGGSYGGYLTALGLARASDQFAAGVDLHGVHNWNRVMAHFLPSYDPLKRPDVARLALESSPLSSVATWRSPVLLIHGDDDRNVPFSETVDLAAALRKQGVEFEQLILPDEVHGFLTHRAWMRALQAAADFLERRLQSPGDPGESPQ